MAVTRVSRGGWHGPYCFPGDWIKCSLSRTMRPQNRANETNVILSALPPCFPATRVFPFPRPINNARLHPSPGPVPVYERGGGGGRGLRWLPRSVSIRNRLLNKREEEEEEGGWEGEGGKGRTKNPWWMPRITRRQSVIPLVRTSPPRITGLKHRLHASTTCLDRSRGGSLFGLWNRYWSLWIEGFSGFGSWLGEIGDGREWFVVRGQLLLLAKICRRK